MDPTEWLGVLIFFTLGYVQIYIYYIHAYGTREGWTSIMDKLPMPVQYLSIPDGILLIYFFIVLSLRNLAAYLVWNISYDNDKLGYGGQLNSDFDGLMAIFFVTIFVGAGWTKSFFTPPRPCFLTALFLSVLDFALTLTSLFFYYDTYEAHSGSTVLVLQKHQGPFVCQFLYFMLYSCLIMMVMFYGFFHSEATYSK
jgi:hypothetical protein